MQGLTEVLAFCLFFAQGLLRGLSSAQCLPAQHSPKAAKDRINITVNGQSMPVGVFVLDWDSAQVTAEIFRILVNEKLGFNTIRTGLGKVSLAAFVALSACENPETYRWDPTGPAPKCGLGYPHNRHHVTFEYWADPGFVPGQDAVRNQNFDSAAVVVRSPGYSGRQGMFILGPTLDRGLQDGVYLDFFGSYNASCRNVSKYFSSLRSIPSDLLVNCSQMDGIDAIGSYLSATGDLAGVYNSSGSIKPVCDQDKWWLSPACRRSPTICIPVITTKPGYSMGQMMQQATLNDMPLAIGIAMNWSTYTMLPRQYSTLLYWFWPDSTFVDLAPRGVFLQDHDKSEWLRNLYRTTPALVEVQTLAAPGLSKAAPIVQALANGISISQNDVNSMLREMKASGKSPEDCACSWLQNNFDVWQSWLPSKTFCTQGQGLVNSVGDFLTQLDSAQSCKQCTPGRFSQRAASSALICSLCSNGSFSSAYGATSCDPCDPGRFASTSGLSQCRQCHPGTFASSRGQSECQLCDAGLYINEFQSTACKSCQISLPWIFISAVRPTGLSPDFCPSPEIAVGQIIVFIVSLVLLQDRLAKGLFHRPLIVDITTDEEQRVLIRCLGGHGFGTSLLRSVQVRFFDTKCRDLDRGGTYRLLLLDKEHAELRRLDGKPFPFPHESSMGSMMLAWRVLGLLLCGEIPIVVQLIGFVIPVNVLLALLNPQESMGYVGFLMCFPPAVLLYAVITLLRRYISPRTSPFLQLQKSYRSQVLRDRVLVESDRGPQRAISTGQLDHFFHTFEGYIRRRTMYYICDNLVKPLTAPEQLSLADFLGSGEANWFISHYWGMKFKDFVESVTHHAKNVGEFTGWQHSRYWICTFANNQHKIHEEVGDAWEDCSFFRALKGEKTCGTLMILDESALPLSRSWCLFEVFQTYKLKEDLQGTRDAFEGLLLGTTTGVLNYGSGGLDVSVSLANKLVTLKVEDAQASLESDKQMIDQLVASHDGGHAAVNMFVRQCIKDALDKGHESYKAQYEWLVRMLEQGAADGDDANGDFRHANRMRMRADNSQRRLPTLNASGFETPDAPPEEDANAPTPHLRRTSVPGPGIVGQEDQELDTDAGHEDCAVGARHRSLTSRCQIRPVMRQHHQGS